MKAATDAELLSLGRGDFLSLLEEQPAVQAEVQEAMRLRTAAYVAALAAQHEGTGGEDRIAAPG